MAQNCRPTLPIRHQKLARRCQFGTTLRVLLMLPLVAINVASVGELKAASLTADAPGNLISIPLYKFSALSFGRASDI